MPIDAEPKTKSKTSRVFGLVSSARAKKAFERMSQPKKKPLNVALEMRRKHELKETSKKFGTFDNLSSFAVFSHRNPGNLRCWLHTAV